MKSQEKMVGSGGILKLTFCTFLTGRQIQRLPLSHKVFRFPIVSIDIFGFDGIWTCLVPIWSQKFLPDYR